MKNSTETIIGAQGILKGILETRTGPWQVSQSTLDFYRSQTEEAQILVSNP